MTQFNVVGQIFDSSGYSMHCRNLANALFKFERTRLTVPLPPDWMTQVNDRELEMIKRQPEKEEINIIITSPLYWKLNTSGKRNWVYLIWEGDKIPKCFVDECLNPDIEYVLVPSEHTKNAICNTTQNTDIWHKILIIPHGVDLNLFYPKEKPDKCIFLANKGLRGPEDRGGIQYLIKAYMEEFSEADNVELILKINPVYGLIDIDRLTKEMVAWETGKKYPKMTINNASMRYEDLVKFYNQGTVFVSPSRGDAFNIPVIEAMACGLPVVTTNFGGQAEYVDTQNGWLIGGEMVEVKWDIFYEGISWLTPDIFQLRKTMREVYENAMWKGKEKAALETARRYTWENTSKQLINLK